jgi:hypothetical protein
VRIEPVGAEADPELEVPIAMTQLGPGYIKQLREIYLEPDPEGHMPPAPPWEAVPGELSLQFPSGFKLVQKKFETLSLYGNVCRQISWTFEHGALSVIISLPEAILKTLNVRALIEMTERIHVGGELRHRNVGTLFVNKLRGQWAIDMGRPPEEPSVLIQVDQETLCAWLTMVALIVLCYSENEPVGDAFQMDAVDIVLPVVELVP